MCIFRKYLCNIHMVWHTTIFNYTFTVWIEAMEMDLINGITYKDCGLPHGMKVCHIHWEGIPGTNIGKTSSFRIETQNMYLV